MVDDINNALTEFDRRSPVTTPTFFNDNSDRPAAELNEGTLIYIGGTTQQFQVSDGSTWQTINASGGATAPANAPFVTAAASGDLTAERTLTASGSIAITDNGANSTIVPSVIMSGLTYAVPTVALGAISAAGSANTLLRSDCTIDAFKGGTPENISLVIASAGTDNFCSRHDHAHLLSTAAPTNTFGATGAVGSATSVIRTDARLVYPQALMSTANNFTATLTDDGTDVSLTASSGDINLIPNNGGAGDLFVHLNGASSKLQFYQNSNRAILTVTGGSGLRFAENIGVGAYPVTANKIHALQTITTTTTDSRALNFDARLNVTSGTRTAATTGEQALLTVLATHNQDVSGLASTLLSSIVVNAGASGTFDDVANYRAIVNISDITVTELSGLKIESGAFSGVTIDDAYGVYHAGWAAGPTKKWAFYANADPSLFTAVGTAIVAKTGAYTLTDDDHTCTCATAGGAFTITLPAASGRTGRVYVIKKTDASANAVTVDGNAAETIDGAATVAMATIYDSIMIQCDGSNWHIIG
jgi:hypothetical protein